MWQWREVQVPVAVRAAPAIPLETLEKYRCDETDLGWSSKSLVRLGGEADAASDEFRHRYLEVVTWLMYKAMVCEARGETKRAGEYIRPHACLNGRPSRGLWPGKTLAEYGFRDCCSQEFFMRFIFTANMAAAAVRGFEIKRLRYDAVGSLVREWMRAPNFSQWGTEEEDCDDASSETS